MNKQTQSVTENALDRIYELIREIVKRSGNGNCIYRGEPEHYNKVSSSLYRFFSSDIDSGKYDLNDLNDANLKDARNHIRINKDDLELLTEMQHYGDRTNLIDFTTDYHIALFFACNGSHDKDGRIIVLQRSKEIDEKYRVNRPLKPVNRVTAQKSIFTQPQNGFIDPNDFDTVTVPADLKQWILIHLLKFQDISIQSIYNDLHGFIRNKELRYSREAIYPLFFAEMKLEHIADNNPAAKDEEQKEAWRAVIAGYTKRLEYSPYDVELYVEQYKYYLYLREYDCAIAVCSKALLLNPNHCQAHFNRGLAFYLKKDYGGTIADVDYVIKEDPGKPITYALKGIAALYLQDWEKAKLNLETAKEMDEEIDIDFTFLFHRHSQSVSDFEQEYNVKIPEDIAEMLTPPQT